MKVLVALFLALTLSKEVASLVISNGQKATKAQFPYLVGISSKISNATRNWCGGSLISSEYVLTAAHCTKDAVEATVYLGITYRLIAERAATVSSNNIIRHEKWNPDSDTNDICLIRIPAVTFTSTIRSIKLPSFAKAKEPTLTYDGEWALAAGWGRIAQNQPGVVNDLQFARLSVISNANCKKVYGNKISSFKICTDGTGSVSTCRGDSGGPLVTENDEVLIGVASLTSARGCDQGSPAIFMRVSSFLGWIKKQTGIVY